MRSILLTACLLVGTASAAELTMFAPAVEFTGVEWLSITHVIEGDRGYLGEIKRGSVTGSQKLKWRSRTYDITAVRRTETQAIEVEFEKGRLVMTRDPSGFFLVDVIIIGATTSSARFRTTRKAIAHDDP